MSEKESDTSKNPKKKNRGFMRKLWNPFSVQGKELRLEAKAERLHAQALLSRSIKQREFNESLFMEQRQIAGQIREERRKNHFSELFQYGIPTRHDTP